MRTWQVERRKRTRHLIELGGLVVKSGIVDLTGDDRATIFGALLWMADKLQSDQGEHARGLWAAKGKQAFEAGGPLLPTSKDDARVDAPKAESIRNRMLHAHAPCLAGHDVDALGRRVAIVEVESGRCHLVP
jgi:conjugative transfer protein TraD